MTDVVVVGAGVVGASIAFHLAERGVRVLVVDRDHPVAGSTARSGGIVSCHENTAAEADLAWESLTAYFERWGDRVGGGCGFTRTGSVELVGEADRPALEAVTEMHRSAVGVDVSLIAPADLAALEPAARFDDVVAAAAQPRSGYADPSATTVSFLQAAFRQGAGFERHRVTGLVQRGGRVAGVRTTDGDIGAQAVVLAAGAWSVPIAADAGVELRVRPSRIQVMLFERPYSIPMHLTMGDAINDLYLRSTADRCTLAGRNAPVREWLDDPDDLKHDLDSDAIADVATRLAARFPVMEGAPYRLGRTAILDMTEDGKAIMGPVGPEGLYAAVGWSGSGFAKAPAVGAELARWVLDGQPQRRELAQFNADRFANGSAIAAAASFASDRQRLAS